VHVQEREEQVLLIFYELAQMLKAVLMVEMAVEEGI
jgi:hypothetical protein